MSRDPRYDVLFESVKIGPVTARNRFFQVPHCNGMGMTFPDAMIGMRAMKAEGGWGVVCTEETDFHPSNDLLPIAEGRLWDSNDVVTFSRMTDAIHEHEALAGIELTHTGHRDANLYSREIPLSVSDWPVSDYYPVQARAMSRKDIKRFREWHKAAVRRAKLAGFDVIYIYVRPGASMPGHFLSETLNRRTDEYGGSFRNRARLFTEMLEDAKEAVGDRCAIAVRLTVDDPQFDAHRLLSVYGEVPDLWDVNIREWRKDSLPSRFGNEAAQEDIVRFVKSMTTKPVVGVGRFTSPDTMVRQIRQGVLDFIGAARPSIADPFLPKKIEEGRIEDIRECIGCNICVSADFTQVPLRCTQNPTMGEEWRKGWHPEFIPSLEKPINVLVVGAGPAGLECALALGKRGATVTLAERAKDVGGRVSGESSFVGFEQWSRVRDYRKYQLSQMTNVATYLQSDLGADDVETFGADHIVIATGAQWCEQGLGRSNRVPITGWEQEFVKTPEHRNSLKGRVLVFDDDHYYTGAAVALELQMNGVAATLVTPASDVATWSANTLEQGFVEEQLYRAGVRLYEKYSLSLIDVTTATITHTVSGATVSIEIDGVVLVTMRHPERALYDTLVSRGIKNIHRIGDCLSPSTIAAAVYGGHRFAREFEMVVPDIPFRREHAFFR